MARFCPHCGSSVQEKFEFCPKCGTPLPELPERPAAQNAAAQSAGSAQAQAESMLAQAQSIQARAERLQAQAEQAGSAQAQAEDIRAQAESIRAEAERLQARAEQLQSAQTKQAAPQPPAETSAPRAQSRLATQSMTILCRDSQAPIGTAEIPEGFSCTAKIFPEDFNDFCSFRDAVLVYSNELGITIRTDSAAYWDEYQSFLTKQGAALGGLNPNNQGAYREPEELMLAYGKPSKEAVLRPYARAKLPGAFAQNGPAMLQSMIQRLIDSDQYVSNVKTDIVNTACEPLLIKFVGQEQGRDIVVLVGCEFMGFEYRNAISPLTAMGGTLGLIGGLLSIKQSAEANRPDGSIPFGHAREHGKQTDIIHWGYNRIYSCVTPPEREAEATEAFLRFIVSFRPDEALARKRAQRAAEIEMQTLQRSNAIAAQARQNQIMAQQRAMETSRMIAQNSAEMSAGIMDSWNKKMASDSRISAARSEAIRGVNSYQTTYGTPVEVSVAADHVYQNNYGDVYGVSGTAVDQDVLKELNWTELQQK